MIRWENPLQTLPLAAEAGTPITQRRHVPFSAPLHKCSPQKIQVNGLPVNSRVHLGPYPCLAPRLCRADFSLSFLRMSWSLHDLLLSSGQWLEKGKRPIWGPVGIAATCQLLVEVIKDNLSHCHFLQLHRSFKYSFVTLPSLLVFLFPFSELPANKIPLLPPPS